MLRFRKGVTCRCCSVPGHVLYWCYLVVVMYMQCEGLSLRHVQVC